MLCFVLCQEIAELSFIIQIIWSDPCCTGNVKNNCLIKGANSNAERPCDVRLVKIWPLEFLP